ncbi:MAG: hypothetical protein JWO76_1203 [Nocardioides sp.]|nr:hypothetical protein [Nocardioides sp.]
MNVIIQRLLRHQCGVVARRQVLAAGLLDRDVRRLVRRREWAIVHDGVYVDHTGPPTWLQLAWAGVLFAWPAALCHDSAVRAADGPGRRDRLDGDPIHVAVDRDRAFAAPSGIVPHRLADLDAKVQWNLGPPRVRVEQAVLDVAAESRSEFAAIAVLAKAVQSRRTTADRIQKALAGRTRIARREFLSGVLRDVAEGTCSVLEHGYLDLVERPHGLPRASRQLLGSSRGPVYRDVEYQPFRMLVELDGRLFHTGAEAHSRDLDRDLDAAVDGRESVRLGWGQVFDHPCWTAAHLGILLRQRGWEGQIVRCPACPDGGGLRSSRDSFPPLSA